MKELRFVTPSYSAEREGFEPPVQLPVHRISSAARSTTPASLQIFRVANIAVFIYFTLLIQENYPFFSKNGYFLLIICIFVSTAIY